MSNLTTALIVVLSVNVFLMLTQAAVHDLNPDQTFFNEEGTIISRFDSGGHTLNDDDPASSLPSSEGSVSPTTGNIFTDAFSGIKSWFLDTLGLGYLFDLLGAPYRFLMLLHLPQEFVFGIGSLWYAITLFLIIAFMFGRDS